MPDLPEQAMEPASVAFRDRKNLGRRVEAAVEAAAPAIREQRDKGLRKRLIDWSRSRNHLALERCKRGEIPYAYYEGHEAAHADFERSLNSLFEETD